MDKSASGLFVIGRAFLGLYFILPGIMKVINFNGTAAYMESHGMVLVPIFLILTIGIQLVGGLSLLVGYRQQQVAFVQNGRAHV